MTTEFQRLRDHQAQGNMVECPTCGTIFNAYDACHGCADNWLETMRTTPQAPSPVLGMCACGHEGVAGAALCFVCASHEAHALGCQ